ncbi:DUF4145 domain-containing protein [Tichowtungia aerotolerans]|uniref:DUF4145 domain-containing protein n=1 Tax=Tichowtungia aerotolerans TaxID=2697043 RepID=A0A6P1MBT2_9BACT|nr:DUF4145 domain-containing protein [Tichowtungia aerotolerans]QHI69548.1 DUF4145 domain-containing protein [Tichowtungia aerotolerans]
MNREIFKQSLQKTGSSPYPCPICNKGQLQVVKDRFHYEETSLSKSLHGHEAWEPEWISYIYSCFLKCSNSACAEIVSSTGNGELCRGCGYDEKGFPVEIYDPVFSPKYFNPPLQMFQVAISAPEPVRNEIIISFSHFFSDPSAAAIHIRIALEHLLTHLKIKRFNRRSGKLHRIALHQRIDLLPHKFNHVRDLFYAIKWLGNAGSHDTESITQDDICDAYELLEELLSGLFPQKRMAIERLAKKINKKRGPR